MSFNVIFLLFNLFLCALALAFVVISQNTLEYAQRQAQDYCYYDISRVKPTESTKATTTVPKEDEWKYAPAQKVESVL